MPEQKISEEKIAVIDLGSNSLRLIIWRIPSPGVYIIEDKAKEMVRISEGMGLGNQLRPEPMMRTLAMLKVFAGIMDSHKVTHVRAVATAALRRAHNREVFLERALRETGIQLSVISGEEESADAYYGVVNTLPVDNALLMDTGGGSCQLILVRNRGLHRAASLPLGAVALSEQYLSECGDPPPGKAMAALDAYVRASLQSVEWLHEADGLPIVALGGNNRALAKLLMQSRRHPLDLLHGYTVDAGQALRAIDELGRMKEAQRALLPGIDRGRADIILGGLRPLAALMRLTGAPVFIASETGLREGLLYRALNPSEPLLPDVLACSLHNLAAAYHLDLVHAESVARLTLMLYEQLRPLHGVEERYLRPLLAAAMLHDIGQLISYENHELHGFYLMTRVQLYGLSHAERIIAALLVSMHRLEDGRVSWREYEGLVTSADVDEAEKLSVLLKIAEKLDRNQPGRIESVECFIGPDVIEMVLRSASGPTALQVSAAMKNEKAFERVFDRRLVVM